MRILRPCLLACLSVVLLSACATRPEEQATTAKLAFAPERQTPSPDIMSFPGPRRGLAGRTIRVSPGSEIILARGEVVLTFDDGPFPGRTEAILRILDQHGVKATFFMVGQMAKAHPDTARLVAAHGHTIGTHSHDHRNLASLSYETAAANIEAGQRAVAAATGGQAAPFFRFPYLDATPGLRNLLAAKGIAVVHPTVDSKDYFSSSADEVRARTIAALERRGSGVILFHDIQQRTVNMLPAFLDDLAARGFSVVRLAPASSRLPLVAVAEPDSVAQ